MMCMGDLINMSENTDQFVKQDAASNIFGVSVRAWVTLLFVGGIVGNQLAVTVATLWHAIQMKDFTLVGSLSTVGEPFATLSGIAVGFYFGQKLKG